MSTTTERVPNPALHRVHFGEYLVEQRAITDAQLLDSLAGHWAGNGRVGDVVVEHGYAPRAEVERLAHQYHAVDVVYV